MTQMFSRRQVLIGFAAWCATEAAAKAQDTTFYGEGTPLDEGGYDPALLPPAESEVDFPITRVDLNKIPKKFHRQLVNYSGPEWPGTIVVDPAQRYLFHVLEGGEAMRYGVGVGRAGFAWSGVAKVGMKRRWPRWLPPREMVARDENAAKWANGMPGGPKNPLGARALYLYADGVDTLYRIHGTNDPKSIGKAMSSGCIRMLNEDIAELYLKVPIGTEVVVRSAGADEEPLAQINSIDELDRSYLDQNIE